MNKRPAFFFFLTGTIAFAWSAPASFAAPLQGPALAGVNSEGVATRVDLATGRATRISGLGLGGYRAVVALEFNAAGTLFGVDGNGPELLTIDVTTRQGTPVGGIGFRSIRDLAFHAPSGFLYGIEDVPDATLSDRLIRIDPATGQGTLIGNIGPSYRYVRGLASDPATGVLYACDPVADQLITVNHLTGAGTPVASLDLANVKLLAFSPSGVLYAVNGTDTFSQLVTIDKVTGHGTDLGGIGFQRVDGMAFHPGDGELYGIDGISGQFLRIATVLEEPPLGVALGPLGYTNIKGLAFVRSEAALYATDNRNFQLLRINGVTGQATVVGPLRRPNEPPFPGETIYGMDSLAFRPGGQGGPATLYGADNFREILYSVDRATAQTTDLGFLIDEQGATLHGVTAIAWDTHLRMLFGVNSAGAQSLIRWNPSSGRWAVIGSIPGYTAIRGMVYVPRYALFAASAVAADGSHKVIAINKTTGAVVAETPLGASEIYGLAHDPISFTFAGVAAPGNLPSALYRLDVFNGQATTIGSLGASEVEGLALDSSADVLYGSTVVTASNPAGQLIRIDLATGQGTVVGPLGFAKVHGLAFNPMAGILYGADSVARKLITIDTTTGEGTFRADLRWAGSLLPIQDVAGLAYGSGILYGVDGYTDKLFWIDAATGIGTPVHPTNTIGFPDVEGLEFDSGFLYGTDAQTLQFVRIHPTTGIGTAIGSTGYKVDGLALRAP